MQRAYGACIFHVVETLENAAENYWNFRVLDYIPNDDIPNVERNSIIDRMISDTRIKNIIRLEEVSKS